MSIADEVRQAELDGRAIEKPRRKAHLFDFRGKPIAIWVPRLAEEQEAQVQAARMIAADAGAEAEVDPDLVTVNLPTQCLLAMVCRDAKDPDGWPYFPGPQALQESTTSDEQAVLLDLLNAAVLSERVETIGADTTDDLDVMPSLAACADVSEALQLLAGWPHARVVRLAHDLSKVASLVVEADDEEIEVPR